MKFLGWLILVQWCMSFCELLQLGWRAVKTGGFVLNVETRARVDLSVLDSSKYSRAASLMRQLCTDDCMITVQWVVITRSRNVPWGEIKMAIQPILGMVPEIQGFTFVNLLSSGTTFGYKSRTRIQISLKVSCSYLVVAALVLQLW